MPCKPSLHWPFGGYFPLWNRPPLLCAKHSKPHKNVGKILAFLAIPYLGGWQWDTSFYLPGPPLIFWLDFFNYKRVLLGAGPTNTPICVGRNDFPFVWQHHAIATIYLSSFNRRILFHRDDFFCRHSIAERNYFPAYNVKTCF